MKRTKHSRQKPKGRKTGPKSKCTPEVIVATESLCKLGLTDWQLAAYFEVSEDLIGYWKKTVPQFKEALKRGRLDADVRVANALYQRALGYQHPAVQFFKDTVTEKEYDQDGNVVREKSYGRIIEQPYMKQYPPDVKAATKILAVRHRDTWGESWKSEKLHKHLIAGQVDHKHIYDQEYLEQLNEFSDDELLVLAKLGVGKQVQIAEKSEPGQLTI